MQRIKEINDLVLFSAQQQRQTRVHWTSDGNSTIERIVDTNWHDDDDDDDAQSERAFGEYFVDKRQWRRT